MERGIHNAAPHAKVIVWNWGWKREWEHEALELLPDNLYFMCVSESGKAIEVSGIKSEVGEYSISQMGPSTRTSELWKHAKERGLKIVAKIQINNSWESPFVPYLPVPYLIREHLGNLHRNQVDGIMLSWTLGGYPGGNLELLTHTPEEIVEYRFGKMLAPAICKALYKFSEAFKLFPFHVKVLYYAPLSCGPGNLLWLNKTGFSATMVGFPYDDLSLWRGIYSDDVMEMSFKQLSETWQDGLDLLELGEPALTESALDAFVDLKNVATAAYCHFRSIYLQIRFIRLRGNTNKLELLQILDEEIILAKRLHAVVLHDSRIGFEASNHYFYTVNDLKEKVLNCEHIKSQMFCLK
ncbi:MAG: hypothetical protein BWY31_01157 [Lentisphaerae bacterium ADurb.Bin242]|nr:MAG: hypothetical protein BWY31_01157 [Lentisphaerae bacterium ADurb.Bin242]